MAEPVAWLALVRKDSSRVLTLRGAKRGSVVRPHAASAMRCHDTLPTLDRGKVAGATHAPGTPPFSVKLPRSEVHRVPHTRLPVFAKGPPVSLRVPGGRRGGLLVPLHKGFDRLGDGLPRTAYPPGWGSERESRFRPEAAERGSAL